MSDQAISAGGRAWVSGVRDATPLLGGYIPVAISFGLIAMDRSPARSFSP